MFSPNATVIDAFVDYAQKAYREAFPGVQAAQSRLLEQITRTALETLANCDCPYHDVNHTIFVTDVGFTILKGRMMLRGDVDASDWLHAVVAMLFHDIGFLRGILAGDREGTYVIDAEDATIKVPQGGTDASLNPHHVTRSCLYIRERFGPIDTINVDTIARHIEHTRFPVPQEAPYMDLDSMSALVRCADLIGQMADPDYVLKLSRLYQEFKETGTAEALGYANAGQLRESYPQFFYKDVYPYIGEGLIYLRQTKEGQQWIANLFHHIHAEQIHAPGLGPERVDRPLASVTRLRAANQEPHHYLP